MKFDFDTNYDATFQLEEGLTLEGQLDNIKDLPKRGEGFELISAKVQAGIERVQRSYHRKYNIDGIYNKVELKLNNVSIYEQDVILLLQHNLGLLEKIHRFWWGIRNTHATETIIQQLKNYIDPANFDAVSESVYNIAKAAILMRNIPVMTLICNLTGNHFTEYKFKNKYHILDVVGPKEVNTSLIEGNKPLEELVFPKTDQDIILIKDFGKLTLKYRTADFEKISFEDINTYVKYKEKVELMGFQEHGINIGNLMLVLYKGKPKLFNMIYYTDKKVTGKDKVTTFNNEKAVRESLVHSWRFFNPTYLYFLTVKGLEKPAKELCEHLGVNATSLTQLVTALEKGWLISKSSKFDINVERNVGREISGSLETKLFLMALPILSSGIHKKVNLETWDKVIAETLYTNKKGSNYSLKK